MKQLLVIIELIIKKSQHTKYTPHYKRNSISFHLKKNHIIKKYLLLSFFLLHFPFFSFGFSETEIETLEATGKKYFLKTLENTDQIQHKKKHSSKQLLYR